VEYWWTTGLKHVGFVAIDKHRMIQANDMFMCAQIEEGAFCVSCQTAFSQVRG